MPPAPHSPFAIETPALFDGEHLLGPRRVEISEGRIVAVLCAAQTLPTDQVIRLAAGSLLAPGFIDVQVNGGGGALLNDDPSVATIRRIAEAHRRFGTTGLLPTLITDSVARLDQLHAVAREALAVPGVLGFHLEGPHLNLARKGIHPPEHIRLPDAHDRTVLQQFGAIGRSLVTLAPECTGLNFVAELAHAGVVVAAGHSDAQPATVRAAVLQGLTGVTHLFNAMSQIAPRAPGLVGATLADERLFAGIICDELHVDPLNLRLAFRLKGAARLMLITDAMPSVGSDAASFRLQGREIVLRDGRLVDEAGTLAGAHLTMIEAVRRSMSAMGATLVEALQMASLTPARFLGLEAELGMIRAGHRADLVALDTRLDVAETWIAGRATA